jgi:parallel beta-helix repeat protein
MTATRTEPRRLALKITLLALALAGCDAGGTTGPDTMAVTGVVINASTTSVDVGATLQLQASVQPSGVSQGVTWTSSDVARATVEGSGLVTGVQPGPVTITATSTADPARSATVQLTVVGCAALAPADVTNGASLPANSCYLADLPLAVNSGTLTIGAGTRIEFGPNAYLTINSGGRLNARGTAGERIRFTATDAAGSWRGINFNGSRSAENVLHHVDIENGGSAGWSGAAYSRSAVLLQSQALADIQNSTITGSGGQGITVYGGSEMTFQNNTLSSNAIAAWVHPDAAQYIGANTTFSGNTENNVRVVFGNTDRVSSAATWPELAVPYRMMDRFSVEAPLTLAPGVTLEFVANGSMIVQNGGSLKAIGETEKNITFRSTEKDVVYWKGLQILTASADNVFEHVTFENGGSQAWTGAPDSRAMVYLQGNSKALFTFSRFIGSAHYGLWVPAEGDITGFNGNEFVDNARVMIVHPNRVGGMTVQNKFSDNDEARVRVTFGNTDAVLMAQTWPALSSPYLVMDRTYIRAPLTIEAGAMLEFAQNANLVVTDEGTLRAQGEAGRRITFSGSEDLTGYWKGIQYNTASAANMLAYVDISNAGSQAWFGGANSQSSVHVTADGSLALSNAVFAKTTGYAVIVSGSGSLSCFNVDHGGFMYYYTAIPGAVGECQ